MLDSRPISKGALSQPCSLESAHHTQSGRRLRSPSGQWGEGVGGGSGVGSKSRRSLGGKEAKGEPVSVA